MPDLDQLFRPSSSRPDAFSNAQVWEAEVTRADDSGVFVVVPAFSRHQRWGPCLPRNVAVEVGELVTIAMSNTGRPWLLTAGKPGEPGPAGEGDKHYTHTQGTPSATWTVNHNLGKWPSVTVIDTANTWLLTDVEYIDADTLIVSLRHPASGKALVN